MASVSGDAAGCSAAPELIDLSGESRETLDVYGIDRVETEAQLEASKRAGGKGTMHAFSTNCLLARRLVERGVRFVRLYHGSWDHHHQLNPQLRYGCEIVDQPVHINDFHATLLHLFGLDHLQLTYRFQGRDFRFTDVGGRVIQSALS